MSPGALQHELRQTRPFSSSAEEATVGLLRTCDVLRRALTAVVDPRGITLQQYNVLRILRGAGPTGLPTLEVATRMIEQAPGVTRLLDRLEGKGLAVRRRSPEDARRVLCRITAAGMRLLADLDRPMRRAGDAFFSPLRVDEQRRLIHLLDDVRTPLIHGGQRR